MYIYESFQYFIPQDERSQFMTEANEYKQRLEELEKSQPRRPGFPADLTTQQSDDIGGGGQLM
jgi:hypothetical protein